MSNVLLATIVISVVTMLLRAMPFILFKEGKVPPIINYLGNYLPYSIMVCLVVYCLKDVSFSSYPFGLSEIISIVVVVLLHLYKRNTLVSIIGGTLCYMVLVNFIFK